MSDEISQVEPKVEAVFAPGLPPIVQKLYGDDPDDFTAAGSPAPTKQSGIEAEHGVQVAAFVFFAVVAVGPGLGRDGSLGCSCRIRSCWASRSPSA